MSDNNEADRYAPRGKILVIDDSPVIREMLTEILTDEGFDVETAIDGVQGTALVAKNDYLVIICDVHMPRQNGLETVREIMAMKPDSRIIMTDSLPDKMAGSATREGALCCLQKPFDVTELRNLLNQVITQGRVTHG